MHQYEIPFWGWCRCSLQSAGIFALPQWFVLNSSFLDTPQNPEKTALEEIELCYISAVLKVNRSSLGARWHRLAFPFSLLLNTNEHPKICSTSSKRALKAGKVDWLETTVLEKPLSGSSWVFFYNLLASRMGAWNPEPPTGRISKICSFPPKDQERKSPKEIWQSQPSFKTWAGVRQLLSRRSPASQSLLHDPDRQVVWSFCSSGHSEAFCLPALHPLGDTETGLWLLPTPTKATQQQRVLQGSTFPNSTIRVWAGTPVASQQSNPE